MNDAIVAEVLKMLRGIDEKQDVLSAKQTDLFKTISDHVNTEEGDWRTMNDKLTQLTEAIPEGDMKGHHDYHTSVIDRNRWITQLCKKLFEELAKYGLLGFLGWLGYQAWIGFLAGPK